MAIESSFDVPAIVPGTPATRDFRFLAQNYKYPYRTLLGIDNRSGTTVLVTLNGRAPAKRVASGKFVELEDVVYFYQVDAVLATNLGDVSVYENGGLDEAPRQEIRPTVPTEVQ